MSASYPVQLVLEGRTCVVIGGGSVAARKVSGLLAVGAKVVVVAPEVCKELIEMDDCTIIREPYAPRHLEHADLVFACTDDPQVNRRVASDARARRIWCNVADQPKQGDFYVSAVLRRGELEVSVGTSGRLPEAASAIRRRLEKLLPNEYAVLIEELANARGRIQQRVPSADARRNLYDRLCQTDSLDQLRSQGVEAWRTWFEQLLQDAADPKRNK
jgi:precorrin-2 dehydrogenase/sirohydrochlorin ferrochelatase